LPLPNNISSNVMCSKWDGIYSLFSSLLSISLSMLSTAAFTQNFVNAPGKFCFIPFPGSIASICFSMFPARSILSAISLDTLNSIVTCFLDFVFTSLFHDVASSRLYFLTWSVSSSMLYNRDTKSIIAFLSIIVHER